MTAPPLGTSPAPRLGLVCITFSEEVRFRTITRTRLLKLPPEEQQTTLRELYQDNIRRLSAAIDFCKRRSISLYRITSSLFPSSEEGEPGFALLDEMAPLLARTGSRATSLGIRMVMHPDQFVVLSSESATIRANSVKILAHHARVLDLLGQPQTAWAALQIHGGKSGRGAELAQAIRSLPEPIRNRVALENDEFAYGAADILEVCREAGVPMVFDAHHHICHDGLDSYDHPSVAQYAAAARETWPDTSWQLVHISNGKESFNDPRHADKVTVMPSAFASVPFIEVEAKAKEEAISLLRRRWKP